MQAIITKFLPHVGVRGSRIKATALAGSVIIDYPHDVKMGEDAHRKAAEALCDKMGWKDKEMLICGSLPKGQFVFVHGRDFWLDQRAKL